MDLNQPMSGKDAVTRTTDYCETAALSCLQAASNRDPSAMVQHHAFWLDGVQKALQARNYLDRRILGLSIDLEANKVLDLGCGFGCTMHYLHQSRSAAYSGLTISRLEHTLGTEAIEKKNLQHHLRIFCADYHDALSWRPFPVQDLVYSIESLHLSWNPPAILAGVYKSLRKEGLFAVADFFAAPGAATVQDEKLAQALRVFKKGYGCPDLLTMDDFAALGAAQGLELRSRETFNDGFREGLLERLGSVISSPFGLDPAVKAWRGAEHAAAGHTGALLKAGLLDFGFMVFCKP